MDQLAAPQRLGLVPYLGVLGCTALLDTDGAREETSDDTCTQQQRKAT